MTPAEFKDQEQSPREDGYLYDNERREILPFVPQAAGFILDVGCGTGRFAALLKERNKATVWGIEQSAHAAGLAGKKLDKMFNMPVEDVYPLLGDVRFDAIIMLDILEHLPNPEEVVARLSQFLKGGGVMICSIPNIRYFKTLRDLFLFGDWEYQESGILDRTHIRFFTFKSINNFFIRLGFEIIRIEGINPSSSLKFKIANALLFNRFWDCKYLQFACVVRPANDKI